MEHGLRKKKMNWRNIEEYNYGIGYAVLLRVEYADMAEPVYTMGFVHDDDIMWGSHFAEQVGWLCSLFDIGKGNIAAVYYIDPKEILK